jgi:hypothetical protein
MFFFKNKKKIWVEDFILFFNLSLMMKIGRNEFGDCDEDDG